MVSTFNAFTVARMGMFASQQAMQVTGNNISNVNTEGYTRQSLDQFSLTTGSRDLLQSEMIVRIGNGVIAPTVSHDRDIYLDIRYRDENTLVGNFEATQAGLERLGAILDEVGMGDDGEGVLEGLYNEMIENLDALANQGAGQDQYDSLFREAMGDFTAQLNKKAVDLESLYRAKKEDFQTDLDETNQLLTEIRELNATIRRNHVLGAPALEQEDLRNMKLDELSKYIGIDVSYTTENVGGVDVSKLMVYTSTEPNRILVDGIYVANIARRSVNEGAVTDPLTGETITFDNSGDATTYANQLNQALADRRDSSTEYKPIKVEDGVYTVCGFGLEGNFDLDIEEVKDIHGNTKIVRTRDGGVIKNRDIRVVKNEDVDENGDDQPKLFRSEEDAQAVADELNKDVLGTEFRVVVTDSGDITIHEFGTTLYSTREEAVYALADLEKDYSKQVNEQTGEVTKNDYVIQENGEQFEIHLLERFYGEVRLKDQELGGTLLADRELLTEKGVFATEEDLARDPDAAKKRGIQFYQNALDVLAYNLATVLNEANQLPDSTIYQNRPTGEKDENGNEIVEFLDEDGNVTTNREKFVLKEEYAYYNGGVLLSNHPDGNGDSGITARNISISKNWMNGSFRTLHSTQPNAGSSANDNLQHMWYLLSEKTYAFTPESQGLYTKAASNEKFFTGTLQQLMTNHISASLATDTNVVDTALHNYKTVADDLYVNRDGEMGVDLNDEAVSIMKYQASYNAACRLMTIYDEMVDRLINGTGS